MKHGRRILPYLTADETAVTWEAWWLEQAGTRSPLPKYLSAWDYATDLTIGLTVTMDADLVVESTGLDRIEQLALVLIGDCRASQRRFTTSLRLFHGCGLLDVSLRFPPGQLASSIDVSASLVLAEDVDPRLERVQHRGSRLAWSPNLTVILEGDSSRFPTEPVSFSAAGYEAAPWTVSSSAESLEDSLMGSVRLLINEDHPWGTQLLEDPDTAISKQLQVDVFRALVEICADLAEDELTEFEDDSLGGVVDYMCQFYLRRGIHEAMKVAREEPLRFDRLVYSAVTP